MATKQDTRQCRALTADGERCTRPAGEDGYCYQHGPEDETVDETSADGGQPTAEADADEETDEGDAGGGTDEEAAEAEEGAADESEESEGATDEQSGDSDASAGRDGDLSGVMDVRARIESVTGEVVGAPLDRIIEIERRDGEDGEEWLVVVEALERSAIPDTEDLLGRYAIQLGADGGIVGYRLRERYRRSREISDEYE
ncbi:gas vesicle protein GvpO, halophile-type [Halorarum salinum]|uniref:Gas vesicle protein n=1 Tax=Halorarum salinum TaxID=2743089 RepID=A0A7D5L8J1_9EURY|nr:gas vesicle protein GvpO [Halobaculum salinum]QLG60693.1 gas vesicle protein [Halobaculum salinum]